jgi:adenylate kinase
MRQVVLIRGPGIDLSPGAILGEAAHLDVISAGNLLREHVQRGTPAGARMNAHMQAGELVPDDLVVDAVAGALAAADRGWVLSGFPNTIDQAVLLTDRGYMPDTVVELVLVEDEIDQHPRLAAKREILQVTLPLYQQQVEPLRRYYQMHSAFHAISGTGHHEDVGAALVAIVSAG